MLTQGPFGLPKTKALYTNVYSQVAVGSLTGSLDNFRFTNTNLIFQNNNGYDTSTGVYTAKRDGTYAVNTSIEMTSAFINGQYATISITVGGKVEADLLQISSHWQSTSAHTSSVVVPLNYLFQLKAGDTLTFQGACTGSGPSYTASVVGSYLSITCLD